MCIRDSIAMQGIGPGIAYYFGPINLYLSGTLALSRFWTYDGNGSRLDTSKIGLSFELQVGKEWWVSRDWGLGIAAGDAQAPVARHPPFLADLELEAEPDLRGVEPTAVAVVGPEPRQRERSGEIQVDGPEVIRDAGADSLHGDAVSYTHLRAHETVLDLVC